MKCQCTRNPDKRKKGSVTAVLAMHFLVEIINGDAEIEAMEEVIAANSFPGPLATNYWQGHYYGLPQDTNTQVLLWNQELFTAAGLDSPPATLYEFATVACTLTTGEEQYGYALGGTYFWAPAPIFYAMGGQVVDADITTADGYINGPESVAAFEMLVDEDCIAHTGLKG